MCRKRQSVFLIKAKTNATTAAGGAFPHCLPTKIPNTANSDINRLELNVNESTKFDIKIASKINRL